MDKKVIQMPVILDSVKILKDKSVKIALITREVTGEEVAAITSFANKEVWMGMSELAISKLDVPEEVVEFKGDKSPSQRLRNRMYVWFEHKHGNSEGFKIWYDGYINKLGDRFLDGVQEDEDE